MDFGESGQVVKRAVFWFTVPMLIINISFMLFLLGYTFFRFRKIKNSSWITKLQFLFIYMIILLVIANMAMYNMT